MTTEELKSLNKPENLLKNLTLELPIMGLPPEVLSKLILMLSEIARYQAPMQEKIRQLPTWTEWKAEIQPEIVKGSERAAVAVRDCENALKRDYQTRMDSLESKVAGAIHANLKGVGSTVQKTEQRLQARDNTPKKRRLQWMGIGAALPILLSGLWWLLKTFWL